MKRDQGGIARVLCMVPPSTLACLLLSSAAMVALSFAIPLTVLQVYDRIIAYGSRSTLAWLSGGCIAAIALNALLEFWRSALGSWTAARFMRAEDEALMAAILSASPEDLKTEGPARHLERFRILSGTANAVLARALPIFAEAPFALAYLALLVAIGREASLAAIGATFAEFALALALKPKNLFLVAGEREKELALSEYIVYALDRIHFIKAQALEHSALRGFEKVQLGAIEARDRRLSFERRLDEGSRLASAAASFGTILWGGVLISRGELTIGAVSACLFFAARLVGVARSLRRAIFSLGDAQADLRELDRGLELPSRTGAREPELPRGIEGRLEFAAVSAGQDRGRGGRVERLSFVARPGEFLLVEGPDRPSSSLVCRLAAGMVSPEEGLVLVDAYPSSTWNFRGSNGAVGYISSASGVLEGSILDNIASFDPQRRESALDVAQLLGLDKAAARLSRGFESGIGPTDPGGLSSSATRLVTIARSLAQRPRILVWDEAEAELDADARGLVLELLASLRGATTLILNSQDQDYRRAADRRLVWNQAPSPARPPAEAARDGGSL